MKMKKYKLFWKLGDADKNIIYKGFNDEEEYYSFLKKQFDDGYRQIIVSSEIMIELIKDFVINQELKIYKIEFAEEDQSLIDDISNLRDAVSAKPVKFNALIEKLLFLSQTSSIDISRIYISGRLKNGAAVDSYVQSNGIVAISENIDNKILDRVSAIIERCLFG